MLDLAVELADPVAHVGEEQGKPVDALVAVGEDERSLEVARLH